MSASATDLKRWIEEAAPALCGGYVHRIWRAGERDATDETWVVFVRHHENNDPAMRPVRRVALEISLAGEVSRLVALPPEGVSADDKKLKKGWGRDSLPYLSLLRREMVGARVTAIEQLPDDRIACLRVEHDPSPPNADAVPREAHQRLGLWVELMGRQGNLILTHEDDPSATAPLVLASLNAARRGRPFERGLPYRSPPPRDQEPKPATLALEVEPDPETLALGQAVSLQLKRAAEELQASSRLGVLRRGLKKAKKRQLGIQSKLVIQVAEIQNADRYEAEGDLIKTNLAQIKRGAKSVTLTDYTSGEACEVTIKLDPAKDGLENMKARYKRAKKLRRGEGNLMMRQGETDAQLEVIQALLAGLDALDPDDEAGLDALEGKVRKEGILPKEKVAPKRKQEVNQGPRRYRTTENHLVMVGRSDAENDRLTMRTARGNDLFFHVAGCPGSHVILRVDPKRPPNHESLVDAATLAVYYSKARQRGKVDVHYTPRKWVKKPRGAKPGLVQISNFKTVRAGGQPDRTRRMLDSLEREGDDS